MTETQTLYARTKPYARDYSWKSWWCILSTTFFLAGGDGGNSARPAAGAARLICSGLTGLLMVRLFVIYHDHQHRAILPKSRLAEFFMRLFGIWALSPSSIWRSSHDHHHAHNSKLRGAHIGSFPIMTKEQYPKILAPATGFKYLFMRHPLTILFGYIFVFLFGMVIIPFFSSPRKHSTASWLCCCTWPGAWRWCSGFGWLALLLTLLVPFLHCRGRWAPICFMPSTISPASSFKDKGGGL